MFERIKNLSGVVIISPVVAADNSAVCEVCGKNFEELIGRSPGDIGNVLVAYEKEARNEIYFHQRCYF